MTDLRIICDLDGTLTRHKSSLDYLEKQPNLQVIDALRRYQQLGYQITVFTARGMRSSDGNLSTINVETVPGIRQWLRSHQVPCDDLIIGKPWCGSNGFYVDDRAVRPQEFVELSPLEIGTLLGDHC